MKRKLALALALVAALAGAATVRPPRATPLVIPSAGASDAPVRERRRPLRSKSHKRRPRHAARIQAVDLNAATASELARIPGVNAWLAERIVEYRALVGPFESLDDLSDLDGISPSRLASLGRYVVVR